MTGVTVSAVDSDTDFWGTAASALQSDITVANGAITGSLKYLASGQLVTDWGAGNFLGLAISDVDSRAASVKVGLEPSQGSGLVEILGDPDMMGVFKITDKDTQKFVVLSADTAGQKLKQVFDLSGLEVASS